MYDPFEVIGYSLLGLLDLALFAFLVLVILVNL
jgi:hypothetical protein